MIGALIVAAGLGMASAMGAQQVPAPAAAESQPQPIDQTEWIKPDAYPAEALRVNEQGLIVSLLEVDATGKPRTCRVTSGVDTPILNKVTCDMLLKGARFVPAKDKDGKPIASVFESRHRWVTQESSESKLRVAIERAGDGYLCSLDWEKRRRMLKTDVCKSLAEAVVKRGGKPSRQVTLAVDDPTPLLELEQP